MRLQEYGNEKISFLAVVIFVDVSRMLYWCRNFFAVVSCLFWGYTSHPVGGCRLFGVGAVVYHGTDMLFVSG